ncbi:Endoglucanase 24 [Linum perenne]
MAARPTAWTSPETTTTLATMSSSDSPWPSPPPCSPGASLSSPPSELRNSLVTVRWASDYLLKSVSQLPNRIFVQVSTF